MTTPARPSLLPHLWKSTLITGVLSVILGVLVLVFVKDAILVAAVLLGAWLLVSGVAQVVFAFSLHVSAGGRILLFLSGAASLILALLAFRQLGSAVWLLAIWIGIGFIFRGVATTVSAISDPDMPGRGWDIFFGVISLIAGIVVMASPLESLKTLTLVVGIWLVITGIFEIASAFGIRKGTNTLAEARDTAAAS